eukprot:406657_1
MGARCCIVAKSPKLEEFIDLSVETVTSSASGSETCLEPSCEGNGGHITGCTAYAPLLEGVPTDFAGSKIEGNNCKSQRQDDVLQLSAAAICAKVETVGWELTCETVESTSADTTALPSSGVVYMGTLYLSTATCPSGTQMIDCTSFMESTIDDCGNNQPLAGYNHGEAYLGITSEYANWNAEGITCAAYGSTDNIRAQAHCCALTQQ